jgi:hypothetical protein
MDDAEREKRKELTLSNGNTKNAVKLRRNGSSNDNKKDPEFISGSFFGI